MSVIRTARQQHADPVTLLTDLQRQPHPTVTSALRLPTTAETTTAAGRPQPARGP